MSRYIDAEVMIANALQDSERLYLESVAKHTPSINIVRCNECKWCDDGNGANRALICTNEYIDIDCHPDFYCGYGEREGE